MAEKQKESFSTKEVLSMMREMMTLNEESQRKFAENLANSIVTPPPTDKELERRKADMELRIQQAKEHDLLREQKRMYCSPPAQPTAPHMRTGRQWGQFQGESVIAWAWSCPTEKTATGSKEGPAVLFGFCPWCKTEFKPGDPDYNKVLAQSGLPQAVGIYPMNQNTGNWQ